MNYLWMQKPTALPMMSAPKLTIITQANLDAYQTGYQAQRQLYCTTENWLPRNKIIMSPVQPRLLAFANNCSRNPNVMINSWIKTGMHLCLTI
jgi:hypothetical protein